MAEQTAFERMRALRDDLRARLEQNEDFLAWRALDEALRNIDPRLPRAAELVVSGLGGGVKPAASSEADVLLSFDRRDRA